MLNLKGERETEVVLAVGDGIQELMLSYVAIGADLKNFSSALNRKYGTYKIGYDR
jgi:hypothetical protein